MSVYMKYGVTGRPVVYGIFAADNEIHRNLYNQSAKGMGIMDFLQNGSMGGAFTRKAASSRTPYGVLDKVVAAVGGAELRNGGLALNADAHDRFKTSLICTYLLSSALVYVEAKEKQGYKGFFATSSLTVLDRMTSLLDETSRKEVGLMKPDKYSVSYKDLQDGVFTVVSVTPNSGGFIAKKMRLKVSSSTRLVLAYDILNYVEVFLRTLEKHRAEVTYLDATGVTTIIETSLRFQNVVNWSGIVQPAAMIRDSAYDRLCMGNVCLPSLRDQPNVWRTVPILGVKNLRLLD